MKLESKKKKEKGEAFNDEATAKKKEEKLNKMEDYFDTMNRTAQQIIIT